MLAYDAIVVGSGQGGNPLAVQMAQDGAKVAVIEHGPLGGTCINTGCTPTKIYVASAQVAHYARQSARWGVHAQDVKVDLEVLLAHKNEYVQQSRASWEKKFAAQKTLVLHRGTGRFTGPGELEVNGQQMRGAKVFIDTGTNSTVPKIPGLSETPYLTNRTLLELTAVPAHLLVLGAGYIGLEFAQMFRRFGSEVTMIGNGSHILPNEDDDLTDALKKALESEGIRFELNTESTGVSGSEGKVRIHTKSGTTYEGSHLLLATGRHANTGELNLEAAGIATDEKGYIQVNDRLETTAANTWALGDVKGGPAFTHISYNDFQIVYGNLFEGKSQSVKERIVPYAVFTDPQFGRVGMSEKQARKAGKKIKVGVIPMSQVARANERSETAGLMKIVVDAENDQVLGAAVLGVEGGETVQILHTVMLAKQPYTLLKGAIYIHPTLAEGLFSLLEAVK